MEILLGISALLLVVSFVLFVTWRMTLVPRAKPPVPVETVQRLIPIVSHALVAAIALGAGYFAGREHVKFELRAFAQQAMTNVANALESPARATAAPHVAKASMQPSPTLSTFAVTLHGKEFVEHDYRAGIAEDLILLRVSFANQTGKDVRAFDGTLSFLDLLGNEVFSASIAINESVATAGDLSWEGSIDYNHFNDRHKALRAAEIENLTVIYSPRKILFSDGSTEEYK